MADLEKRIALASGFGTIEPDIESLMDEGNGFQL